jgi:hypothetical protein
MVELVAGMRPSCRICANRGCYVEPQLGLLHQQDLRDLLGLRRLARNLLIKQRIQLALVCRQFLEKDLARVRTS